MPDRKIEILAPAGSYAAFGAALRAGADAVYAGGSRFGARAFAENFTDDELIHAIREAHLYGKKLYLTVNTLLKDEEMRGLFDYLAPFYKNGLDAVIVQDLGVAEYIRSCFPGLDIHASTQMTVTGVYGAKFAEAQGMTRVVPARELSLEEIRQIHDRTDLEIECFVHGALCYCYSGQCLMSSMIGGRSGNRGQCAQPCRLPYTFDGKKRYYLSPKDICTLEIIPDLVDAGINSFKIEGRMKKPEYVALATSMYRRYTDMYLRNGKSGYSVHPSDREMLMDLYNRGGSSCGYYKMRNGREMISPDRPNHAGVPAAEVQEQKGREVHALVLTDLAPGDVLDIAGGKSNYTLGKALRKGEKLIFLLPGSVRLKKGRILCRIRNASLLCRIKEDILSRKLQRGVRAQIFLAAGRPALLKVCSGDAEYEAYSEEEVQAAKSRPMDADRIRAQIQKTGDSEFFFEELSVCIEGEIFIPVGQLNHLRRTALDGLREKILSSYRRDCSCARRLCGEYTGEDASGRADMELLPPHVLGISVAVETMEQLEEAAVYIREGRQRTERIYIGFTLLSPEENRRESDRLPDIIRSIRECRENSPEIFAALPHIFRTTEEGSMLRILKMTEELVLDGILVRSCDEFYFLYKHGFDKTVILDHNLYVFNRYAKKFWNRLGVEKFTAPLELNRSELLHLGLTDCELEIYGHVPVMVSAQCLFKTSDRCKRDCRLSAVTDRRDARFPVRAYCGHCYNVIYSSLPLSLMGEVQDIGRTGLRSVRISFTTEDQKQVRQMFKQADKAFAGGDIYIGKDRYTQGRFRRGVL